MIPPRTEQQTEKQERRQRERLCECESVLRGRHSVVRVLNGKVVKMFPPSLTLNFWKEVKYLLTLQPLGFVPKIYRFDPENLEIEIEIIKGVSIAELLEVGSREEVLEVLEKCMDICFKLDKMGIQKCEMNHPDKHIIVSHSRSELRPIFIDFERAYDTKHPKNVTQFAVYIANRVEFLNLRENLTNFIELFREYKRKYSYDAYISIKRKIFGVRER
ncbi:MAG: hypothetical protein N2V73_01400 [Candidatus Methanospirare jalkutatii]|nr:hypothetical protein [Candidatus Methanospirare jalkutatii]